MTAGMRKIFRTHRARSGARRCCRNGYATPTEPNWRPRLLIDAIVVSIRNGQVANRPIYVAIGINLEGERDVLGLWVGPAGGEGAKFKMSLLTELRNRGVQDTFIVCCHGLKGLPDAIRATWPWPSSCVSSIWCGRRSGTLPRSTGAQVCRELRGIYTAPTLDAAAVRFGEFADTWRDRYPAIITTCEQSWGEFVPYLELPIELRTVCTPRMKSSTVGGGSLGLPVGDEHFLVPFLLLDDCLLVA
jgi:transposase-like protein